MTAYWEALEETLTALDEANTGGKFTFLEIYQYFRGNYRYPLLYGSRDVEFLNNALQDGVAIGRVGVDVEGPLATFNLRSKHRRY